MRICPVVQPIEAALIAADQVSWVLRVPGHERDGMFEGCHVKGIGTEAAVVGKVRVLSGQPKFLCHFTRSQAEFHVPEHHAIFQQNMQPRQAWQNRTA
jgi:hypothetical protein